MPSVPKPEQDKTDYQSKSMVIASKIACIDGKCKMPGCKRSSENDDSISGHHIVHRRYRGTCSDVLNLFPCCIPCHSEIHRNEKKFLAWLETVHPGLYGSLREKAMGICEIVWIDRYQELLEEYYELLKSKAEGHEPTSKELKKIVCDGCGKIGLHGLTGISKSTIGLMLCLDCYIKAGKGMDAGCIGVRLSED